MWIAISIIQTWIIYTNVGLYTVATEDWSSKSWMVNTEDLTAAQGERQTASSTLCVVFRFRPVEGKQRYYLPSDAVLGPFCAGKIRFRASGHGNTNGVPALRQSHRNIDRLPSVSNSSDCANYSSFLLFHYFLYNFVH